MANPSHDKGNVDAAVIAWWEMRRPLEWTEEEHVAHPTVNCMVGVEHDLANMAAQLVRRATPPSPSTAPEVDVRHEFEMYKSNLGEAANYIGDGQYGNHGVTEQADAFRAGVAVGRRAALASRPAEVDDEGLPPLPASVQQVAIHVPICEGYPKYTKEGSAEPWEGYYTAEQYRQGQRDAVAADRAKVSRAMGLLREARAALETWKDVAPAVSLCADIDKVLAGGDQ